MAGLQAIHESLAATCELDRFDFFVLSDTRKPEIQRAERAAFDALRERLGDDARVFYRLRDDNHERKAGNISDWVRRWGGAYPQFLILDAASRPEERLVGKGGVLTCSSRWSREPEKKNTKN